jgi:hypothetical protein
MLDSSLRVTLAGRALLHDGLRFGAAAGSDDHVALAPGHRVVVTACVLGLRPQPSHDVLTLDGPGALRRASGTSLADVDAAVDELWRAWSKGS